MQEELLLQRLLPTHMTSGAVPSRSTMAQAKTVSECHPHPHTPTRLHYERENEERDDDDDHEEDHLKADRDSKLLDVLFTTDTNTRTHTNKYIYT